MIYPRKFMIETIQLIKEFYTKRRVLIPITKVPPVMIQALLSIEDSRFYHHLGIDPIRMIKAFWVNLIPLKFSENSQINLMF
jgi:membrane carboxypeptidase/penicillin-binding protein